MSHSNDYLEELKLLHNKKTFGTASNIPNEVKELIENQSIKV
jgi:hypothetical protein